MCALQGQFDIAIKTAQTGIQIATVSKAHDQAEMIKMRLKFYKQRRPYLERLGER